MGLLDDAIREHLELKRQRGADAEEVARLEQEALGPPQRGEFAGLRRAAPDAEAADAPPPEVAGRARAGAESRRARAGARARAAAPRRSPSRSRSPSDRAAPAWLEDEPRADARSPRRSRRPSR